MSEIVIFISNILVALSSVVLAYFLTKKLFYQNLRNKLIEKAEIFNKEYQKQIVTNKILKNERLKKKPYKDINYKIEKLIARSGIADYIPFVDYKTIITLSLGCGIIVFIIFQNIFGIISISLIASVPGMLLPAFVMEISTQKKEEQIEKVLGDYLLQLKNNTRIHNDIIEAFRAVQNNCLEPLSAYTKQFIAEINSGISVEKALESFKDKVEMKKFKLFLTNVQYCYIYGGNFTELLDKTYRLVSDIQKEKRLRIRETRSARIVIYVLILLDVFVYFNFIMSEPDYLGIMKNTFYGQLIMNMNFLSIWFMLWLSYSVKKLDY